jgi:hypothetical protein
MTFAFNCVTVALLYLEFARYFLKDHVPSIKSLFDGYFKSFCDERERKADAFIITHILLLMGCALPVQIMFIITQGGFVDKHWKFISMCGLVYLGIGDTTVR